MNSYSFGGGTDIGCGLNRSLAIINAETINDVSGGSVEIGGSISPIKLGPISFGAGYDVTISTDDSDIKGSIYSINGGVGVLPADIHAQLSWTSVSEGWLNVIVYVLKEIVTL